MHVTCTCRDRCKQLDTNGSSSIACSAFASFDFGINYCSIGLICLTCNIIHSFHTEVLLVCDRTEYTADIAAAGKTGC